MSNSVILRRALDEGDLAELSRLLAEDSTIAGRTHSWGFPCRIGPCQPISYLAQARFNGFVKHQRAGEMARILFEAGAPVDGDPTDEETLLITAASYNEVSVARTLVDAGANLEAIGHPLPMGHRLLTPSSLEPWKSLTFSSLLEQGFAHSRKPLEPARLKGCLSPMLVAVNAPLPSAPRPSVAGSKLLTSSRRRACR